jgi:hypothetical protein
MRRSAFVFFLVCFVYAAAARSGCAQAVESADRPGMRVVAGGMASVFNSNDQNDYLIGGGAFLDVHLSHWVQLEGEARFLRWNQYLGEQQDNYLIGPRVPLMHLGRKGQIYGKALIGYGRMTFPAGYGYGSFTALAFGETVEFRMSRRLTFRALDFEYQDWPKWVNNTSLYPFGVSVGVGYRVH